MVISAFTFDLIYGIWVVIQIYLIGLYSVVVEFINDRVKQPNSVYIKKLNDLSTRSKFQRSRREPIAIVTGAGGAIGSEIVYRLLSMGYRVIAVSHQPGLLKIERNKNLIHHLADFKNLNEVRQFSSKVVGSYTKIDLMFCCAGAMLLPYKLVRYGKAMIESHMAINLFSHAILISDLCKLLQQPGHNSRIVLLSSSTLRVGDLSEGHFTRYLNSYEAYANSKLAVAIYASWLQRVFQADSSGTCVAGQDGMISCTRKADENLDSGKTIICSLHPGCVSSLLYQRVNVFSRTIIFKLISYLMRTKETAASEVIATAMSDFLLDGAYYEYMNEVEIAISPDLQKRLYERFFEIFINI